MQLSQPIFLWALAGLAIPVAIHLLSRKEGKVIRLGSIRHVQETSTKQFKSLRLNELLLLALRCLLIILFSLLLSGPHWKSTNNKKWVLIEKGLENQKQVTSILDSLKDQGYESRWLAKDFPLLKDSAEWKPLSNYRRIVNDILLTQTSEVLVFAQNKVSGFSGTRSFVPDHIRWISVGLPDKEYILAAIKKSNDSIIVRKGITGSDGTSFINEISNKGIEAKPAKTISVLLASDPGHTYDRKIMMAVLKTIQNSYPVDLVIKESGSVDTSAPVDISISLLSNNSKASSKSIILAPQNSERLIIHSQPDQWIITRRLNEETALRENLTLEIASVLLPERDSLEGIVAANDRRVMPDSVVWASASNPLSAIITNPITEKADPYLIVFLLLILLTERMVAYHKNQ
ncbi:MAG: hypothetical protein HOP08_03360 [Cyclobacteriaceae bacterium]|nr:hypothetical protein [Cyclobacteriaceae bacterium]